MGENKREKNNIFTSLQFFFLYLHYCHFLFIKAILARGRKNYFLIFNLTSPQKKSKNGTQSCVYRIANLLWFFFH